MGYRTPQWATDSPSTKKIADQRTSVVRQTRIITLRTFYQLSTRTIGGSTTPAGMRATFPQSSITA
jgi:hypothetical protein